MKDKLNQKTKVIFRMWLKNVIALFPQTCGTNDPTTCLSYALIGQHSAATPFEIIRHSRLAKPKEYRGLARELKRLGYRLDIKKRTSYADYKIRASAVD